MHPRQSFLCVLILFSRAASSQPSALQPEVRQTADLLGISSIIVDLESLRDQPRSTEVTVRTLMLRQRITEAVTEADLDVDSTVAGIQREQSQIQVAQGYLSSRRDQRVGIATLASTIAGGGIGIIGSAMQFSDRTAYAGDAVSIASGAASVVLSLLGVRLQRGGKREIGIAPNMLAPLFDRPAESQSSYAPEVWAYLNNAPASGTTTETRIERLKREWVRQGRLPSGSDASLQKVERMASSVSPGMRMSLADLSDRYSMLSEVRAQVALMKRDLAELVHYLGQIGW